MKSGGFYFFIPKFLRVLAIATISLAIFLHPFAMIRVYAASADVVISELQTGAAGAGNAGQEFIELHNLSDDPINISGWKLVYSPSADTTQHKVAELQGQIPGNGFVLLVSSSYMVPEDVVPDILFGYNSGLSANGGHIKLVDNHNAERDRLGWGNAQFAETQSALAPLAGQSLQRIGADTDDNWQDFIVDAPTPTGGDLQPAETPPDPEPMAYLPITITELLPDPASPQLDSQDEFIELYNPNDELVQLKNYVLQAGLKYQYTYVLPAFEIEPQSYLVLYSAETKLVLSNTSSQVRLSDPAGKVLSETSIYKDVKAGKTWALIGDVWQITSEPTPGKINILSAPQPNNLGGKESTLAPCPAGKFRNPLTNRCKMIDSDKGLKPCNPDQFRNPETNRCKKIETANGLTPCRAGQYRNPATNRCKSTATTTSSLKPCNADQFRNPATNRCKKKDSVSGLKPCNADQERNPETNRCRKVAGASTTNALSNPAAATKTNVSYPALIAVAVLALGYGAYEYRQEIKHRVLKIFGKSPNK